MSVIAAATRHIVTKLKASADVQRLIPNGVHEGVVDENHTAMPYVLVQTYGDSEETNFNDSWALSTVMMSVRVVMPAVSLGELRPLYRAVHKALENTNGEYLTVENEDEIAVNPSVTPIVSTYVIADCSRDSETNLSEVTAGRVIRYLGGRYELVVA